MPNFTRLLCNYLRSSGGGNTAADVNTAAFDFTSIQVNKNYAAAMHVDKNNLGPS